MILRRILSILILCGLGALTQAQSAVLTNTDVVGLAATGLSPDIIVAKIKGSDCEFDTSPGALKTLKAANLPDAVILAMVEAPKKSVATPVKTEPNIPSGMLRAVAWRAVPWVTTTYYQQQGSATPNCTGSGTWIGTTYQGNSNCTTQYTPAQSVPVNWQHFTIYNLVETSNATMVIACTRNWTFSKCSHLVPGDSFQFESKGGKVSVIGRRNGKGKDQSLDFDVVSNSPR